MALEDLGTTDEDQLGLAQSPYVNFSDPLAYARTQQTPSGTPGLHVQGAQPQNILQPRIQDTGTSAPKREAPQGNPLSSPLMQQQGAQATSPSQNGLFGDVQALLQARAGAGLGMGGVGPIGASPPSRGIGSDYAAAGGTPYAPDIVNKIKATATKYGIDPNVAVAVFRSEGASGYRGDGGSSFGPFQLHMGGINPNMPHPGLGDSFFKDTGLDPRDPKTVDAQIDYSLKHASENGWGAWSGSRDSAGKFLGLDTPGIDPYYGIKGGKPATTGAPVGPLAGTSSGPLAGMDPQKLWKYMLLRTLFPQFQFHNISYDPYEVHRFAVGGGY